MSEIEEVRERLAAISGVAGARVSAESDDIRALLADHARLQAWVQCVVSMQEANYGDGMGTHLALIDLVNDMRSVQS